MLSEDGWGLIQIVATARNVPTERKKAVVYFSTEQASIQDAYHNTRPPIGGRLVGSTEIKLM